MFAQRIKKLRLEKNFSQQMLANELKISKQNISDWENEKSETSFSMLIKLAKYFDVSTDFILGIED